MELENEINSLSISFLKFLLIRVGFKIFLGLDTLF